LEDYFNSANCPASGIVGNEVDACQRQWCWRVSGSGGIIRKGLARPEGVKVHNLRPEELKQGWGSWGGGWQPPAHQLTGSAVSSPVGLGRRHCRRGCLILLLYFRCSRWLLLFFRVHFECEQ